jgi:methyltransferase (TIGR00027 family)
MKSNTRSFTAEASAVMRYAGRFASPAHLKNPDFLARRMIRTRFRLMLALAPIRRLALAHAEKKFPGLFEGHLSRSHHYDQCVTQSLDAGAGQYVILGAGFDTRAHRLVKAGQGCRIFEVDHPATSREKQKRLKQAGIRSDHVTYVPVDFLKEDTWDRLDQEGFDKNVTTLFTWEGVTMYLNDYAVSGMMAFVGSLPKGSEIVFDYFFKDVITHPEKFKEAQIHLDYVKKIDEPYTFGINPEDMDAYVSAHGLTLFENLTPEALNLKYLKGHHRGVNAWYGIARARVPLS